MYAACRQPDEQHATLRRLIASGVFAANTPSQIWPLGERLFGDAWRTAAEAAHAAQHERAQHEREGERHE